jgi:outer membrane lipoprotein-sorting protein
MKKKIFKSALILCLPFLLCAHYPDENISSKEIINKMSASIDKISTLKFKLKKKERINGELKSGEQDVKFQRSPKKIYTKVLAPNVGVEVLWIEDPNNKKAYVNPNAFPYFTLSLDPYNSILRKNNHHTIHEVGFDYINSIINQIAKKSAGDFGKFFVYEDDVIFDKKNCYKIVIDYTPYTYLSYTVKEGETVTTIAYKLFVSDYMILQLNKIEDYDDVKAGQVIKIPNAYAKKTILFIDKENFLPISQMMYDEKGSLYSQYEFFNLQLNPKIPEEEFTKDYKDYNF